MTNWAEPQFHYKEHAFASTRLTGSLCAPSPAESKVLLVQDSATLDRMLPAFEVPEAVSLLHRCAVMGESFFEMLQHLADDDGC